MKAKNDIILKTASIKNRTTRLVEILNSVVFLLKHQIHQERVFEELNASKKITFLGTIENKTWH